MAVDLRSRNFSPKVFEAVPTPRGVDPGRLVGADRHKVSVNENWLDKARLLNSLKLWKPLYVITLGLR